MRLMGAYLAPGYERVWLNLQEHCGQPKQHARDWPEREV